MPAGISIIPIKACISKLTERHEFPDKRRAMASHTHNLGELIEVAGLKAELKLADQLDPEFGKNWGIVRNWSEQRRYQLSSAEEAKELINALRDRRHGVLRWLKHYW